LGLGRVGEGTSRAKEGLVGALGLSTSAPPRGYGRGSARDRATWILANATRVVLPRMRQSFVDRQYSPSTGMDQSEWEISLEELTCMGLIVKKESVSDGD
jgi:hypothetical protein